MPKVAAVQLDLLDSGELAKPIELLMRQKVLVRSEKLAEDHDDYQGRISMRQVCPYVWKLTLWQYANR